MDVRKRRLGAVLAAPALNHNRSLMSLGYRLGILNRKVNSNPARSFTHRPEDDYRLRFLTEEEEKKFRKVIETKWLCTLPSWIWPST